MNRIPKKSILKIAESIAKIHYGGHFTIMTFTTNVKFCFGTVSDRDEINDLEPYDNINDAIINAIQSHLSKN